MDLKDFVETTLVQIAEGIAGANSGLLQGQTGAVINPGSAEIGRTPKQLIQPVEFDVALTVNQESITKEASQAGGKAGFLAVASVQGSLTSDASSHERKEAISRVRFTVQMQQPGNVQFHPAPTIPRTTKVV